MGGRRSGGAHTASAPPPGEPQRRLCHLLLRARWRAASTAASRSSTTTCACSVGGWAGGLEGGGGGVWQQVGGPTRPPHACANTAPRGAQRREGRQKRKKDSEARLRGVGRVVFLCNARAHQHGHPGGARRVGASYVRPRVVTHRPDGAKGRGGAGRGRRQLQPHPRGLLRGVDGGKVGGGASSKPQVQVDERHVPSTHALAHPSKHTIVHLCQHLLQQPISGRIGLAVKALARQRCAGELRRAGGGGGRGSLRAACTRVQMNNGTRCSQHGNEKRKSPFPPSPQTW